MPSCTRRRSNRGWRWPVEGQPREPTTVAVASRAAARTVVEAFGGATRRAWGGSRNTKARPVGTEEARSSSGELGSGAGHGGDGSRLRRR